MSDQEMNKGTQPNETQKMEAQYTPSVVQPEFLREKIKQKPVNKKKLFRRTIITVIMAVVFGLVACITFLVLEPVISNKLNPEEEAQEVQFPEETVSEEMKPEDMLVEEEIVEETEAVPPELEDEQIEELLSHVEFGLEDYQTLHTQLKELADKTGRAMVTVTAVSSDVDWFNNTYENEASGSGIIVANNGKAMLILASDSTLNGADSIVVTFCNQRQVEATIVRKDVTTGFDILSVPLLSIDEDTMDVIKIASLGSSNHSSLLGEPVIAIGSPLGTSGSVSYGIITSVGNTLDQPDAEYKYITTDIYGSKNATGAIINLRGMVVGIIDNSITGGDMGNLLTAYGISELKNTIERLSNDKEQAYLGVHGVSVPKEAIEDPEMTIPAGAYIKEIEMDSPAMAAGIQSGDVIVRVGDMAIESYTELLNMLGNAQPEDVLTLQLVRQGKEMNVEVTLGSR